MGDSNKLEKMMPGPRFPKLGIADDRRETPILTTKEQINTKARQIATRNVSYLESQLPPWQRDPIRRQNTIEAFTDESKGNFGLSDMTPGYEGNTLSYARGSNLRMPTHAGGNGTMADLSTQEHENFHNMMNRVQKKHGRQARSNLARNILDSVNPVNRGAMKRFFEKRYPIPSSHPLYHEEMLATMLNYLNNPAEREMFHNHMGDGPETRRLQHDRIKMMHRQVHQAASMADENWLREDFQPTHFKEYPLNVHAPSMPPPLLAPPAAMKPEPQRKPAAAASPLWQQRNPVAAKPAPKKAPKKPAKKKDTKQLDLFKVEPCSEMMVKHDSPEFESWFAGSKVIDPQGKPLRVYHGTSKDQDFSTFKIGNRGAWFTTDPESASQYAKENDAQEAKYDPSTRGFVRINQAPRVIPAYLSLKNPYKMTPEDLHAHNRAENYQRYQGQLFAQLKAKGHDGVDFGNGNYVAFHPHQIKSIFNQRPTQHRAMNKAELSKALHDSDEVARLLNHPDLIERRMALKLATVNDKHLQRAFYDHSPEIQRTALNHPAMTHSALMALMRMPQTDSLQMLGMNHKLFDKSHLKALYDTHRSGGSKNVIDAIIAHPHLDEDLIRDIYHDGNATRDLMAHSSTPSDVLDDAIITHFTPGHDQKSAHRYLVMAALKHPNVSHNLVEQAIKQGDDGIKLAAAASPNLAANVAEDILKRGHVNGSHAESFLRSALVTSPHASERHLDMGLEDLNPLVRAAVFKTLSPHLKSKHVDRAIEQGHPHTIIMALKSSGADSGHIGKILNDKRAEVRALAQSYQKKADVKKFEQELAIFRKSDSKFGHKIDSNSEIVHDMLGYDTHKLSTFDAAKYLIAGVEPSLDQVRRALWKADGDVEKAALIAYGIEPSESNLRALRAVRNIIGARKADEQPVHAREVVPGVAEAEEAATAVKNAFDDSFVFPVELGGKHSAGTLLARDMKGGKVYLLKPGAGGISPAAGDQEEAASQSRRETAFWAVAQSWSIGEYFPKADLVIVDGKEYACIELLPWRYKTIDKLKKEDPSIGTRLLGPYLASGALHRWAVIDYILGNPDRHANNLMADASGDTPTPDVKLIDHGSAMAGDDFDPAYDEQSFVPYYLRAWAPKSFNDLPAEEKLKLMPRISPEALDAFHDWVSSIHAHELQMILIRYGVNPEPALARLAKLKMMMTQEPADLAINKLWVTT